MLPVPGFPDRERCKVSSPWNEGNCGLLIFKILRFFGGDGSVDEWLHKWNGSRDDVAVLGSVMCPIDLAQSIQ